MHYFQGFAGNQRKQAGIIRQTGKHPCSTLSCFIKQYGVAGITVGKRLGDEFCLLDLKNLFDAAFYSSLQGCHGRNIKRKNGF